MSNSLVYVNLHVIYIISHPMEILAQKEVCNNGRSHGSQEKFAGEIVIHGIYQPLQLI